MASGGPAAHGIFIVEDVCCSFAECKQISQEEGGEVWIVSVPQQDELLLWLMVCEERKEAEPGLCEVRFHTQTL